MLRLFRPRPTCLPLPPVESSRQYEQRRSDKRVQMLSVDSGLKVFCWSAQITKHRGRQLVQNWSKFPICHVNLAPESGPPRSLLPSPLPRPLASQGRNARARAGHVATFSETWSRSVSSLSNFVWTGGWPRSFTRRTNSTACSRFRALTYYKGWRRNGRVRKWTLVQHIGAEKF